MRHTVAGAAQAIKKSGQNVERCSPEQRNCSFGGVPSKKQSCWSSASARHELSKRRKPLPTHATAHAEVLKVKDRVAGSVQVLQVSCQSAERCSPEQCNCSLRGVPLDKKQLMELCKCST